MLREDLDPRAPASGNDGAAQARAASAALTAHDLPPALDPATAALALAELREAARSERPRPAAPATPPAAPEPAAEPVVPLPAAVLPRTSPDVDTAALLRELAALGADDPGPAAAPVAVALPGQGRRRRGLFGRG